MKTLTVPAHHENSCRDVTVRCLQFVLPRDLDVSSNANNRPACARRRFLARFLANYVDDGPVCGCGDKADHHHDHGHGSHHDGCGCADDCGCDHRADGCGCKN